MVSISTFIYFNDGKSELTINGNGIYINGEYVGYIYVSTTDVVILYFRKYNKKFWKKFYSLHCDAIGTALSMGANVLYGYSPQFTNRNDAITWLNAVKDDVIKTYYTVCTNDNTMDYI